MDVLNDHIATQPHDDQSGNTWIHDGLKYFYEIGRKNDDGAITGTVYAFLSNGMASSAGTFRIEPNGKITRFPRTIKL